MARTILGRADTDEKKRAVVDRIYRAWLENPHRRLGQLLVHFAPGYTPNPTLFAVEDEVLAEHLEKRRELPPGSKEHPTEHLDAIGHLMAATKSLKLSEAKSMEMNRKLAAVLKEVKVNLP